MAIRSYSRRNKQGYDFRCVVETAGKTEGACAQIMKEIHDFLRVDSDPFSRINLYGPCGASFFFVNENIKRTQRRWRDQSAVLNRYHTDWNHTLAHTNA